MARLPVPGSDNDVWGDILNDYLRREHRADGSHNVASLLGTPSQSGQVAVSDPATSKGFSWQDLHAASVGLGNVTNDTQLKATALDTDSTLGANSDSKVPSQKAVKTYVDNTVVVTPDATATTKGKLQLAGDLGGTAASPAVKSRSTTRTVGMAGTSADYVCDGTADEVQINQAISDVAAAGGGEVLLRFHLGYSLSAPILLKDAVHLRAEHHTRLQVANGANCDALRNDDTTHGNTAMRVSNLEIDANRANQSGTFFAIRLVGVSHSTISHVTAYNATQNGIFLDTCSYICIEQCEARNNSHENIALSASANCTVDQCYLHDGDTAGLLLNNNSTYNHITSNRVLNNALYGIMNGDGNTTANEFNHLEGNRVEGNGDDALVNDGAPHARVIGNLVRYNGSHAGDQGIPVDKSPHSTIADNIVEYNRADGIEVKNGSSYCTITGNVCRNNSNVGSTPAMPGTNDGCGIVLRGGITRCTVVGNTAYCDEVTPSQRRGILLTDNGNDYNVVTGNAVYNNSVNQIEEAGGIAATSHNQILANAGAPLAKLIDQPLSLKNSLNNNSLEVAPSGNTGAARTQGAVHITNSGNAGVALGIYSTYGAGAAGPLMALRNGDTSSTWDYENAIAELINVTNHNAVKITQTGAPSASRAALVVESNTANTTANAYGLLAVRQQNAGSTNRAIWIDHAGLGEALQVRAAQGKGIIIDNNGNDVGLDLDHDGNSAAAITSLRINSINNGSGAAYALAILNGRAGFGTAAPTAGVDTPAASAAAAGLRLRPGVAPTAPNSGDVWQDGTHIYARVGSNTYQLDQQSPSGGNASSNWGATDNGLLAWTYDFVQAVNATVIPAAGQLQCARLNVPAGTVTNIIIDVGTAGAGLTSSGAALYQNGTLLGQTADQSTNWTSTNGKVMPLITPAVITAGYVYVAFWANGTTLPAFQRGVQRGNVNVGLAATAYRFATTGSGVTSTPPTSLGTLAASSTSWWVGLS